MAACEYGAGLHLGDFGIGHGQTAAAMAHHGVGLMQGVDLVDDFLGGDAQVLGQRLDLVGHVHMGHELMQRRIQVTDGHGTAFQGLVHGLEVALLHGQDLGQRLLALLLGVGEDHLAHGRDAVGLEEHVLGAAQADALGAERHSLLGIARGVGVGAHLAGCGPRRPSP